MKKGVIIFLHLGYWMLYALLLLLIFFLVRMTIPDTERGTTGVVYEAVNDSITVKYIIAGGAADKQGHLRVGDIILSVQQENESPVNLSGMELDQALRFIRGKKGKVVRLTVKKGDGSIEPISIKREAAANTGPSPKLWFVLLLEMGLIPGVIAFYIFYGVLFPRLLSRRKVFALIVAGLFTSVLVAVPSELMLYFSLGDVKWSWDPVIGLGIIIGINALLNGVLGLVMRGFISWYGDIKVKEDLAQKNFVMELELVKSQINPHFLFNTLNNIDVLILKDPPKASAYLNQLSDMMRFMLYEAKTERVPLSRELGYIEKYLALQKIRTANPDYVQYSVKGSIDTILLEPMLFIPFIENAFKHAENRRADKAIEIGFVVEKDKLKFECKNLYVPKGQAIGHSGLGNELIKRRLALLYPNKHRLTINDDGSRYCVELEIDTA